MRNKLTMILLAVVFMGASVWAYGTTVTVNDNTVGTGTNQFNYQGGGWSYGSQSGAYANDNHWDLTTNDYFTFQFNGTQASVYGSMASNGGIAAYSVDGGAETNFDDYAATRVDNVFLFATPILSNGLHTLKVRVTGTKNPSSGNIVLPADRIDVSSGTLPSGWTDLDIGSPGLAGSATYSGTTYTVNGGGADIWGTSDQFNYAETAANGDVTITARVVSQQNTNPWAKAGVMIRDTTGANAAHVYVYVTPGNGAVLQYRSSTGASASIPTYTTGLAAPYWVRLVRSGSTFTGSISPDGTTWTTLGSVTATIATNALGGLAVTAHDNTQLNTSTFDNVAVSGLTTVTVNDNTVGTGTNQFNYQGGGWLYGSCSSCYANDNHWDLTTNDYFTFQFNGTQASVYGSKDFNGGIAAYSVDGGTETNFDDYAATRVDNVFLFATPILSNGLHTLKVRVTGTKNPSSTNIVLPSDRIDVSSSGGGGTVAIPALSPGTGTYTSAQTVTISDSTTGATIYYTTDGSTPTTSSTVYSSPITVSTSETVKAIGVLSGYTNSGIGSAVYTINLTVATPTFSPGAGTYSSAQTVAISDSTSGATIHYTTDGSTPTASSTTYTSPINVATSETVKAIGVLSGYTNSQVGSAIYTIGGGGGKTVSSVLISPHGGVLQPGGTIQFSVTCTYTDLSTDNCANAGGATWSTSSFSSTISSSGLYTEPTGTAWQPSHAYALGALVRDSNGFIEQAAVAGTSGSSITWPGALDTAGGNFWDNDYWSDDNNSGCPPCGVVDGTVSWNLVASDTDFNFAVVTAGGVSDRAQVWRQSAGDTWYQYPTPAWLVAPGPNVVVGSTVTIGSAVSFNDPGMSRTATPFQDSCTWSSSDPSKATVDIHGQVTGVSPGLVTITCGRAGNGVFGNSTVSGWTSPGNTVPLTVAAGGTGNTTWYVRPDGGTIYSATNTNGQCDGKHNTAYSGSGTNQQCAAGNIRYLWADGVTSQQLQWVISGGDTVIVAQNSAGYNTGLDQASPYANPPGSAFVPVNCGGNPDCSMPPVPSGSATQHTRILGANYASCHADSAKTRLNVSYAALTAFNVWGSQFVDIACFEITDEAACSGNGNYTNSCHGSALNYGSYGILEGALTSDVTYTDLFIHGLGADGIHGATGVGVVANYVHIRAMPNGGINMDDNQWNSGNISVAGGLTMTYSTTEWSGCVEEYPVVHNYPYIECRDQDAGGYGDGFGTASTTGNWYFDHDIWQYNFQDGLDLVHSGMQNLTVTNSLSQANVGESFKIGSGDNVVFRNNIAMANCFRVGALIGDEPASALAPGGYNLCRANGNLVFTFINVGTYAVQDNTVVTTNNADTPVGFVCEAGWSFCQNANAQFQNNVFMNYLDNLNAQSDEALPGMFYLLTPDLVNQSFYKSTNMPQFNGWSTRNHNLFYNVRDGDCPTPLQLGETCNTADPLFINEPASPISHESDLDNYNFKPASGSPLIGAGIAIPGITTDYTGETRPNPPSIGAIE